MATTAPKKGLDEATVRRASAALLAHIAKTAPANLLVDEDMTVSMSFHLKRMPGRYIAKPVQIPLPHTLLDPETGIEICIISKDPTDELKAKLLQVPVAGVTKVLAVGKLRKKYRDYQARRELVSKYQAFFCDDRVVTMMPKVCGKVFFDRKKLPTPVRVSGSAQAVAKEIATARDSTYMTIGAGQTISVRIGRSTMTADQVTANVMAAIAPAVENIPKKWKAVGSIYLQATGTAALPIYKSLATVEVVPDDEDEDEIDEEEAAADAAELLDEDDEDDEDDDEEEEEEEEEDGAKAKAKTGPKAAGAGAAKGKGVAASSSSASTSKKGGAAAAAPPAPAAAEVPGKKRGRGAEDAGASSATSGATETKKVRAAPAAAPASSTSTKEVAGKKAVVAAAKPAAAAPALAKAAAAAKPAAKAAAAPAAAPKSALKKDSAVAGGKKK